MTEIPPDATAVPTPPPIPWEQSGPPFFQRLFDTILLVVARPTEAFERMPVAAPLGRPLGYLVLVGWVSMFFSVAWNLALQGVTRSLMPGMPAEEAAMVRWLYLVLLLVAPLLVLLGAFLWAGIVHLFLLMFGAGGGGYVATLRVGCYAQTVNLLTVVPLCGGLVAGVWGIVLQILGLSIAHKTSAVKAALAVLLPLFLCCACAVGLYVTVIAAALRSMSH